MRMLRASGLVFAACLAVWAQAPVTLTVEPQATGVTIPADFAGLSFEASNLLPEKTGAPSQLEARRISR